jgi:NCS1 family nucleobase:cation symporter-1
MVLGVLPNVPGFLTTVGAVSKDSVPASISGLYNYAWFVGFAISLASYILITSLAKSPSASPTLGTRAAG